MLNISLASSTFCKNWVSRKSMSGCATSCSSTNACSNCCKKCSHCARRILGVSSTKSLCRYAASNPSWSGCDIEVCANDGTGDEDEKRLVHK